VNPEDALERILRRIFAGYYRRAAAEELRRRQVIWGRPDQPSRQEMREMLRQQYRPRGIDDTGDDGPEDPAQTAAIRDLERDFPEEE
jgi:hypothetical protein